MRRVEHDDREPTLRSFYFDPMTSAAEACVLTRLGWDLLGDEEDVFLRGLLRS